MKKSKKKKGKAAGKSKKKSTKSKKERSPAEVRQELSKLVSDHAVTMTQAVIGEGEKGQLAPTKYLLELAGVFPASDGSAPTEREESLAETIFRKLNVPTTPVKLNDEEEDEVVVIPAQEEKQVTESNGAIPSERENAEKAQGPSTACIGSLRSPMHSGRDDRDNHKPFTPERTEAERVDAGEPSGV